MRDEKRIALVTPWFGESGTGGSQILATQLARELFAPAGGVDVLTTCCRSFEDDWSKNYYPEGTERTGNVTIRRFGVRRRNEAVFNCANEFLLSQPREWLKWNARSIPPGVAAAFCGENIDSPGLLKYLADWGRAYHAVIFTPYLYGPVLQGVALLGERAYLQPCLHDEAYAYLPQVRSMFHSAKGLLFNSQAEYCLAQQLYGSEIASKSFVVGHWVDEPRGVTAKRRGAKPRGRFVLYLGRADPAKNVRPLVAAFADYRRYSAGSNLTLVLAGTGTDDIPAGDGVVSLGEIGDDLKRDLLQSCGALVQPSVSESFSRAVMEAWSYGKPVAVNGKCSATRAAVSQCGGGWIASSTHDWIEVFATIARAPEAVLCSLGEFGRKYYVSNGTAARVLERYRIALDIDRPAGALPRAARS